MPNIDVLSTMKPDKPHKMVPTQFELITKLANSVWIEVKAMPVQNNREVLLDIVFKTSDQCIRVIGRDHQVGSDKEVFTLDCHEFREGGWWKSVGVGIDANWVPIDIKQALINAGTSDLLNPPRQVRLLLGSTLRANSHRIAATSDRFSAVEFTSSGSNKSSMFAIAASEKYPCAVVTNFEEGEYHTLAASFDTVAEL